MAPTDIEDLMPSSGVLVGDSWITEPTGGHFEKRNPATGAFLAEVALAGTREVEDAVSAARAAAPPWRGIPANQRRAILLDVAEAMAQDSESFGMLASLESGMPTNSSRGLGTLIAEYFTYYAGWVDKLHGEVVPVFPQQAFDYSVPEPYGVVGAITPWNGRLSLGQKVAPALAAGNCVVLKPAELAPFTSLRFANLCLHAGLPPGVLNVIPGGRDVGRSLVRHRGVDKITFTGGVGTGRTIAAEAGAQLKPVVLELGGKSASIVFDDADLDTAVAIAVLSGIVGSSGQGCICPTRLLVERSMYDWALERIVSIVQTVKVGDPFGAGTVMGPVIDANACERILGYVERARIEGAGRLLCGGHRLEGDLSQGYFIPPTVFADVDNSSQLAQNEIFGPVLAVLPFGDEDEAIALANDTQYGLAAYIWTRDLRRAHQVARQLDVGYIGVNGMPVCPPSAPFGGMKASGFGREGGHAGLSEFLRLKNVYLDGV
jgi:acyl-CoA reductase-like NAD-dependent aldehyde dehydrogenase